MGGRQQNCGFDFERPRKHDQFGICDATKLRLDLRECATTQVQSEDGAARGKQFLGQPLLVAEFPDLRANNVLRFRHAPKTELDFISKRNVNCSVIGAHLYGEEIAKMRGLKTQAIGRTTDNGSLRISVTDINTFVTGLSST